MTKTTAEELARVIADHCRLGGYDAITDIDEIAELTKLAQAVLASPVIARIEREAEETGWLIEHEDEPKWITLRPGEAAYSVCWTKASLEALRFARRTDADDYASTFLEDGPIRITEHRWE